GSDAILLEVAYDHAPQAAPSSTTRTATCRSPLARRLGSFDDVSATPGSRFGVRGNGRLRDSLRPSCARLSRGRLVHGRAIAGQSAAGRTGTDYADSRSAGAGPAPRGARGTIVRGLAPVA